MLYAIHSMARGRANRTARAAAPTHRGMVLWVGKQQSRIVRGRPLLWTKDQVLLNLDELKKLVSESKIEVKTTDGRRVDLNTLESSPTLPSAPLPHPPLDSAANDSPHVGEHMPQMKGGIPEMLASEAAEVEAEAASESAEELGIPEDFLAGASEEPSAESPKPQHHYGKKGRRG